MKQRNSLRDWVISLAPATVFGLDEAKKACPAKSHDAIKSGLSRLCQGTDPYLVRLVRGLYSRRSIGEQYPCTMDTQVSLTLPWMIAGEGAGLAPPNIINVFGWSTQVPAKTNIVVIGRPPKPPLDTVKYWQRSNHQRRLLSTAEVSLLEAANGFDMYSEIDWNVGLETLKRKRHHVKNPTTINAALFLETAAHESYRGNQFLHRCEEIAKVYAEA